MANPPKPARAATGVALSAKAQASLHVVERPAEAGWSAARTHAQECLRLGRLAYDQAVLCGIDLLQLQADAGTTRGGDRRSNCHDGSLKFEELVEREVGIPYRTAARWMQAARAQWPAISGLLSLSRPEAVTIEAVAEQVAPKELHETVAKLTEGKTLEQLLLPLDQEGLFDPSRLTGTARNAWSKVAAFSEPWDAGVAHGHGFSRAEYDALHEDALIIRERVESGLTPPARAWAALRGRASTEGPGRAPVDHRVNIETALIKLNNSLAQWDSLDAEDRMHIEEMWQELWQCRLPSAWKAAAKKLEGWK